MTAAFANMYNFFQAAAAAVVYGTPVVIGACIHYNSGKSFDDLVRAGGAIFSDSGEETPAAPTESEVKPCPNPDGCNGKQDHQDQVRDLSDKHRAEAAEGEQVLENKRIRGFDSRRRPDVQTVGPDGRTKSISEAERNPGSARNINRQNEYNRLGVPNKTHGLN